MRKALLTALAVFFVAIGFGQNEFITTWKSRYNDIWNRNEIRLHGLGSNYQLYWELKSNPAVNGTITGSGTTLLIVPQSGDYIVKASPGSGTFTGLSSYPPYPTDLLEINHWGTIKWKQLALAFYGCNAMNMVADDTPDLSECTSLNSVFQNCIAMTGNATFNNWGVSTIKNFGGMFYGCHSFNQNIGSWNVSSGENFGYMFWNCWVFNQNIGNWIVTNGTSFSNMLYNSEDFDQNLGNWNMAAASDITDLLSYTGMSCDNYSKTLIGWAGNASTPNSLTLGANNLSYATNAVVARNTLQSTKSWTINGDVAGSCIVALPIVWGTISAVVKNGTLTVDWTSASETNNDFYEIEISTNGKDFKKIGRVASAAKDGNSNNSIQYQFVSESSKIYGGLAIAAMLGFAALGFKRRRNNVLLGLVMLTGIIGIYSCEKENTDADFSENTKLFVRIAQVDKDAVVKYSSVVEALNK